MPSLETSPPRNDRFFKQGEEINEDFIPITGDRSLYEMPWLGHRGDNKNEAPAATTVATVSINNRNYYIRMDRSPSSTDESSVDTQFCHGCGTPIKPKCNCCHHRRCHKDPVRKSPNYRKEAPARRPALPKRFRRLEKMAMAAFEAEKMGRQLAMAASMFAAGYALGSSKAKYADAEEEDEDNEEEDDDEAEDEE